MRMASYMVLFCSIIFFRKVHTQPRFNLPNSPSGNTPVLQADTTGRVFVSAGNLLFRLSHNLVQEERTALSADVVSRGIALSANGDKVVVCLTDISCSVFNTTNLTSGLLMRTTNNNTIGSLQFGLALFTAGDTFYVGSICGQGTGAMIILEQHGKGFVRSSNNNSEQNNYKVSRNRFSRYFFSGFEKNGNGYFFVVDNDLVDGGSFRVMRACHVANCPNGTSTCGFTALYEANYICNGPVRANTRICGVSIIDNFNSLSGTIAVVSRCEETSVRNSICAVNLTAVDEMMNNKYTTCSLAGDNSTEDIDISWSRESRCNQVFQVYSCIKYYSSVYMYIHAIVLED